MSSGFDNSQRPRGNQIEMGISVSEKELGNNNSAKCKSLFNEKVPATVKKVYPNKNFTLQNQKRKNEIVATDVFFERDEFFKHKRILEMAEGPDQEDETKKETIKKCSPYQIAQIVAGFYDFGLLDNQLHIYCEDTGVWELIPESEAKRTIRKLIPESYCSMINKYGLEEVYQWLLIQSKKIDVTTREMKYWINFLDQAINWKTGECTEDRKTFYFTYAIQVKYCEMTENGEFKIFMNDIFQGDKKAKKEFQKFLGLALSDIRDLKLSFFLFGPSNTGKSVVLNLLRRIIGEESCAAISFSQMSNEFALTQLLGKRINLSGEVSGATNKRLDIFKSITGNDIITTSFKGKDHFTFKNKALLVFACNNFPPIQDVVEFESFLSRIIMFPFQYPKPRTEWIANYEDILFQDIGNIISYAIKGLKNLDEDGYAFEESRSMKEIKEAFLGTFNSFALFAKHLLTYDATSIVSSATIQKEYNRFCSKNEYVSIATNVWPQLLKQYFNCVQVTMSDSNGKRVRAYKGIKFQFETDYASY